MGSAFSLNVTELAELVSGRIVNGDRLKDQGRGISITRASALEGSGPGDVAFFFSREYEKDLLAAKPGVLITGEPFVRPLEAAGLPLWGTSAVLACPDPYLALGLVSEKMARSCSEVAHLDAPTETIVHPSSVVHPSAKLGKGAQIGPHCVVEAGAKIGDGSVFYPGCYVGPGVEIGKGGVFFPGVKIYERVRIGNRARFHAGAVIGADGFGYAPVKRDGKVVNHQKIYHLGGVVIGDDVEIGANACVDRGTLSDTIIENRVKLDNMVQIGHNARLDEGAVICGNTAVAGSARIGRFAYVGGQTGISNKVHVGDGASVAACTLVSKDVEPEGTAVGMPARSHSEHFRIHAMLNKMLSARKKGSGA